MEKDVLLKKFAEFNSFVTFIVDLSMFWTGEDEERIPQLKTIRTVAGMYKEEIRKLNEGESK